MALQTTTTDRKGLIARRGALRLAADVQDGQLLSDRIATLKDLPPEDRARAQRLATALFRWSDRADRMLGPHLRLKPLPGVLNALRLGVVEICALGAAPHGVIDALVTLVKEADPKSKASGLVNAVLRKIAKDPTGWDALPAPRLPKPFRARLVKAYDKHSVAAMEIAHAAGAPLDLTWRGPELADLRIFERVKATVLPTGTVRIWEAGQVSALPGFAEGRWWVQDAAAALPARVLAVGPGERVLDMCAAPGGKTMQLAAAGADVTALDLSAERMVRVTDNLARVGLAADTVVADALTFEAAPFDAILLDAPCSATGTIRRHPDLPIAKAGRALDPLLALQAGLLGRAVDLLNPGGRLVYCTCSLLPEEGEQQVAAALARHRDLELKEPQATWIEPGWRAPTGLRLRPDFWPEHGGLDGFFIASLRKSAS